MAKTWVKMAKTWVKMAKNTATYTAKNVTLATSVFLG
jgi:hypothetical protein